MSTSTSDPSFVEVVIVGNGPSALLLSYILHGNIPFYDLDTPHPDPILHEKLVDSPRLLDLDIDRLTEHFEASRFPYSTQALPVNALLDSLVRPKADINDAEKDTCIQWRRVPELAVPHVVFGNASQPGGQWTECPKWTTWDIQSLSYAGMLSLPGYGFEEDHRKHFGSKLAPFTRPSRREIADYYAAYPRAVGISDSIKVAENIDRISRTDDGFYIASHNLNCKYLVAASGIFTQPKPARPLLQPLLEIPKLNSRETHADPPLLVIGSGFSAADIIVSSPEHRKIIHIYKWDDRQPSPLKGCHPQAYPEYAGIYRIMKRSAQAQAQTSSLASHERPRRPRAHSSTSTPFLSSRQWTEVYEGLPNTLVTGVETNSKGAMVSLQLRDGTTICRQISGLAHAVGRQGSLKYLSTTLLEEILGHDNEEDSTFGLISASTLRTAALRDLEVSRDIFIIGSLTGDSLIRFAYGGCVYVAGKLISRITNKISIPDPTEKPVGPILPKPQPGQMMNGLDGHNSSLINGGMRENYQHGHLSRGNTSNGRSWWNSLIFWWR